MGSTIVYTRKSLKDYVNALVPLFTALAYDVNLLELDGDALTELYDNMLAIKRARNADVGYFSRKLIDFHRFAQSVGADSPEWEALDVEDAGRHVLPGYISPYNVSNRSSRHLRSSLLMSLTT